MPMPKAIEDGFRTAAMDSEYRATARWLWIIAASGVTSGYSRSIDVSAHINEHAAICSMRACGTWEKSMKDRKRLRVSRQRRNQQRERGDKTAEKTSQSCRGDHEGTPLNGLLDAAFQSGGGQRPAEAYHESADPEEGFRAGLAKTGDYTL